MNPMPKTEELLKLEQALALMQKAAPEKEEGDGGEAGGAKGGSEIQMRMFVETFSLIRAGEKGFGPTNEFDPTAYLAKDKPQFREGLDAANRLKNHPILSKLSKFDGDTPKMSMDPKQNPDAQQPY